MKRTAMISEYRGTVAVRLYGGAVGREGATVYGVDQSQAQEIKAAWEAWSGVHAPLPSSPPPLARRPRGGAGARVHEGRVQVRREAMTPLHSHALSLLSLAGPAALSLDTLGEALSEGLNRSRAHRRAQARHLLSRLGAEGLVESGDGGENWRRTT